MRKKFSKVVLDIFHVGGAREGTIENMSKTDVAPHVYMLMLRDES